MKKILFVAVLFLAAGCGGNSNLNNAPATTSISDMEIKVAPESIRVGMEAGLFVKVTLSTGEQIENLTRSFEDPDGGGELPIEWTSSNEAVAHIDEDSKLVSVSPGSVTITAYLMGKSQSKTVRIFDAYSSITPSADESVAEEETGGEPTEPPAIGEDTPCTGHAAAVVSFSPGTGSGYGMDSLPGIVMGPPHGAGNVRGSTHVLSLGRLGEIVLDLGDCALVDGPGADLIVFENAFFISGDPENPYAELGVVGVSEDGVDFVEFACSADDFPYTGCAGWNPVYSSTSNRISPFDIANAGGDHFDLADLDIGVAHYIKIRDAGTEGFGTSVGFDLDAISVVHGVRETH